MEVAIIASCFTIVAKATSFITSITNLRIRYRDVEVEIEVLKSRTRTMRDAADRLRDWLDRNGAVLEKADRLAVLESVETCETDQHIGRGSKRRDGGHWKDLKENEVQEQVQIFVGATKHGSDRCESQ